nr:putative ribonuclease H-like domain-containing protein [Tanacetum cinerariifolium]
MRPFGCPVTILNTLDPLGKFEGKVDEEFLVGYSVSSKAFRVFNSRTRIIQETLHVNFLENKPNVAEHESEVNVSPSSSAQSRKQDNKTKKEAKGKSPVESFTGYRDLSAEFEDFSDNSSNEVNAAGTIVLTVGQNSFNNTNTFSIVGPSNVAASPTYGKSSFIDASQLPNDSNMPELEDITYSDDVDVVGAEADFNNLKTSITVSPIPTTKIHKDHHVSQIIGDLSSTTQTKSMTRVVKDQGGLSQMFNDDFHTWFGDPDHPDNVYKVVKALYGLHQAPRAWYETLANYLLENSFQRGKIDQTLFIKKQKGDILQVQIYVNDIIFGATNKDLCKSFEKLMKDKFQMSSMGELTFFLASTPIDTEKPLLKDPDGEDVDVHTYRSTVSGKDSSNPLMADNLSKNVWYSTHHVTLIKSWLVQKQTTLGQTTTGKEISNPFMAGSLPKTTLTIFIHVNDVTRLQALVDKKKVVVTDAAIREVLRLDDAEGVDCLPNEEIFTELAIMGYEKPSTKLTFYKAFFSRQWKFLIHTILQSMSAKRTSWNEFSSSTVSAVIFQPIPPNILSCSDPEGIANMRRVGKWFSGVETPLFEGMLAGQEIEEERDADEHVEDVTAGDDAHGDDTAVHGEVPTASDFLMSLRQEALDACAAFTRRVDHLEYDKVAQALEITKLKRMMKKLEKGNKVRVLKLRWLQRVGTSQRVDTSDDTVMDDESNQWRMIAEMDKDDAVVLMDEKEEDKKDKTEPAEVQEVVDVVTIAKLITEVVTAASETVTAANAIISTDEPQVHAAIPTAAPERVVAAPSRRKKGVVIRDPKEESTTTTSTIIHAETKSKDKGKRILVEEPKPLKKKQQIKIDEEYARKLHAELKKDIDWDVAIDHVKLKAKEDPSVKRYQAMKRKPQTEAQARKNMMTYLKNVAGFKLDYFKGMSYDDIRPIFEAKFNSNVDFLLKTKDRMEEEENRALQMINETPAEKAAKRIKLNEEVKDPKRHLEIVPDEDDHVYTEATLLARKVPVVDYKIIDLNNKPHYKIIRVDGTHQLYISFLILLKNFDREDLEALWNLVKEMFSTSKPKNFSDDFLLTTLGAMFEKPDAHA